MLNKQKTVTMKNLTIVRNIRETLEGQPTAVKVVVFLTLAVILLAAIALITGLLAGATAAVFLSAPLATFAPGTRGYYFNQLPEPYRTQAFDNMRQEWAADGHDAEEIEVVLRLPCTGIEQALNGAFTFKETPQGHLYWSRAVNGILDTAEPTAEPTRSKIERILWYLLFAAMAFGFIYMVGHTVELVLSLASAPILATRSTDVEKLAWSFEAHGPEGYKEFKNCLIEKGGPDYAHRTINDLPDHLRAEIFKLKI